MTALGALPWIRLGPPAAGRGRNAAAPGACVAEVRSAEELRSCLAGLTAETVVLVDEDVAVAPHAAHFAAEPLLLEAGLCVGFVGVNAVTGLCVGRSLRYCGRERILRHGAPPDADVVVPRIAGTWSPARTPEAAFRAAFATMLNDAAALAGDPAGGGELGLAASLGSDVENGLWWMLGAGLALLGRQDAETAWRAERPLLVDAGELAQRTREVARLVRVHRGIPVRPMAPMSSKVVRQMMSSWPPARYWTGFAEACGRLGPKGRALADAHDRAGRLIWALPPRPPSAEEAANRAR